MGEKYYRFALEKFLTITFGHYCTCIWFLLFLQENADLKMMFCNAPEVYDFRKSVFRVLWLYYYVIFVFPPQVNFICCWNWLNVLLLLSNETNVQLPYLIQLQETHFLQMPESRKKEQVWLWIIHRKWQTYGAVFLTFSHWCSIVFYHLSNVRRLPEGRFCSEALWRNTFTYSLYRSSIDSSTVL